MARAAADTGSVAAMVTGSADMMSRIFVAIVSRYPPLTRANSVSRVCRVRTVAAVNRRMIPNGPWCCASSLGFSSTVITGHDQPQLAAPGYRPRSGARRPFGRFHDHGPKWAVFGQNDP
jgi:hypothetical protein